MFKKHEKLYDIAIVGAGTCGLMAAISLKNTKNRVILFDAKKGARKLAITGNNRCNLTNTLPLNDFLRQYDKNGDFLREAFKHFFRDELISFINSLGFNTKIERDRVLLYKSTSGELASKLLKLASSSVESFNPFEQVLDIRKDDYNSIFTLTSRKGIYSARKVLLACGGKSYPHTGSTGVCYEIAKALSHSIIEPHPIEVPFCAKHTEPLKGLSLRDVELTLILGQKKRKKAIGDIIFTHFGISGPAILQLSAYRFEKALLRINPLKLSQEELKRKLLLYKGTLKGFIKKLLPERLVDYLKPPDKHANQITKGQLHSFVQRVTALEFEVAKCSFDRAFVTAGGVDTKEINPKTMESELINGLHFCGEIMDIQGPIGGFNLQAAFSTGYLAGKSMGENM